MILCLPGGALAAGNARLSVTAEKGQEVITLSLPHQGRHKVFTLAKPDRLVIDLPVSGALPAFALPADYAGALIASLRQGRFNASTVRLVFELSMPVRVTGTQAKQSPGRPLELAVTIAGTGKPKAVKPEKPMIVIDPGHGGADPGALGPRGGSEKDTTLVYALALRDALQATGRYRVALTRASDHSILLRQRVAIARQAKASLFISLHADSAPARAARGLSVYTLSETASDEEAEALAARENKADIVAGMDFSKESEDVAEILISLAQRDTSNKSALLADLLVTNLDDYVRLLPNTHRFAGFAVLKAPDIPSVLVEIGFLTNPEEEKLLKSEKYRQKVIRGLIRGIDNYFTQKNGGV